MGKQFLGFDLAVYIIPLVFGIPVFFFWRWVFRKFTSARHRLITTWVITIISTPVVYVIIVLGFFLISEYYPDRDFNKNSWQTNKEVRYEYTHDLIKSKILIGKTKKEVLQILGNDADTSQIDELGYDIGYRPEITGIDPSYLIIDFKNGKVDTVIEHDR